MNKYFRFWMILILALVMGEAAMAQDNPFLDSWALTPVQGGAGCLEVRQGDGLLEGSLLWMGGSPETQTRVWMEGDTLHCLRVWNKETRDGSGKVTKTLAHPV